jgi:hypothetical protein
MLRALCFVGCGFFSHGIAKIFYYKDGRWLLGAGYLYGCKGRPPPGTVRAVTSFLQELDFAVTRAVHAPHKIADSDDNI